MEPGRGRSGRRSCRVDGLLLVTVLVVGLLVAGGASALAAGESTHVAQPSTDAEGAALAQEVDADRTRIRIGLQPDGDATWTVELWTRLEDDADEEAFASLQADVENDSEPFASDFEERMAGSVSAASAATGREMAIDDVTVSTRTEGVPNSYGVLAYEFEWTNFAAVDGQRLRAGDAIDGFLLEENTRLTIGWPDEYRATSIDPEPDDRTDGAAVWQGGETDFVAGQPRVAVTSAAEDDSLLPIAGVALAVLALLFALAWLVHSGRLGLPGGLGEGGAAESRAAESPMADDERDPKAGGASGADVAATGTGAAGANETDDEPAGGDGRSDDGPPPELLSNEEQVLRLLEDHGGRMKQQQVVAELDWTEAKTSQVVTSMREDDRIEAFRIGRENVLALPGEADL